MLAKSPIISIIIPVHNSEPFIEDCINSIIHQEQFENCELICVDDKSSDNSANIIQYYTQKYPNIYLIKHSQNKKAGGARNTGIRSARGEYIWFIDSDDTINSNALEIIFGNILTNNLDVFCFNCSMKWENGNHLCNIFKDSTIKTGYDFLNYQWGKDSIYYLGYPVIAIIRKSIAINNGIGFIENTLYGEDTTFITEIIVESEHVASTSESLYNYWQRPATSTASLETSWKGAQIYESIFTAGNLIINKLIKRNKTRNASFSADIEHGMSWFSNRLIFRLLRCNFSERREFFKIMIKNSETAKQIVEYMNNSNKFIIKHPIIAESLLSFVAPFYKYWSEKRKIKNGIIMSTIS